MYITFYTALSREASKTSKSLHFGCFSNLVAAENSSIVSIVPSLPQRLLKAVTLEAVSSARNLQSSKDSADFIHEMHARISVKQNSQSFIKSDVRGKTAGAIYLLSSNDLLAILEMNVFHSCS